MGIKELLTNQKINIIRLLAITLTIILWIFLSSVDLDGTIPNSKILLKSFKLDHFVKDDKSDNDGIRNVINIMKNEDPKYMELGRSTWKQFHYTMEQFPDVNFNDKDSLKKRDKLITFMNLFGESYPCIDQDSNIFLEVLDRYPLPINLNKIISIEWGCHIHNLVNEKLDKGIFNCSELVLEAKPTLQDFNQDIEYDELNKVSFGKEGKQLG